MGKKQPLFLYRLSVDMAEALVVSETCAQKAALVIIKLIYFLLLKLIYTMQK